MSYRLKPIKTEKDYNSAISYLNSIIDAPEDSPEGEIKEILTVLIEKYEEDHYPISPPHSIDAIKFRMEQAGLSRNDLIPYIGSRSKVSEVLSGKRDLTLKMIRALNKHLGIPAESLIKEKEIILKDDFLNTDFDKYPVKEMQANGAFKGFDVIDIKDKAEEAIRFLIEKCGGLRMLPEGLFRKSNSTRLNTNMDIYALQGWSLHVISAALGQEYNNKYNRESINDQFIKGLLSLSILKNGVVLTKEYLANHGIILVTVPHLKNTYLDGAAFITKNGIPIIGMTLRYDRIDNFWFTLLHEIGHIIKHLENCTFIADDMTLRDSSTDDYKEKEADEFAERALLPYNFNLDKRITVSKDEVLYYAKINNIHPAIVAGRIQYTKKNYRILAGMVGRGEVRKYFFGE